VRLPFESVGAVGLVVDLAAPDGDRLPPAESRMAVIEGVPVRRLPVAPGADAPRLTVAALMAEGAV